jgi:hypothetical protein
MIVLGLLNRQVSWLRWLLADGNGARVLHPGFITGTSEFLAAAL